MRKNMVQCLMVCVAIVMGGMVTWAGDNWVGTWKLNTAKSELGSNAVRAQKLTFVSTPL